MISLKGKKALITGGTAGIGRAIAQCFAEAGADVAIFGTNRERAQETVSQMQAGAPSQSFRYEIVDVSKASEAEKAIETVLKEWENIDILVNNAGIVRDNLLMKMSEEEWDRVIEVNLKSMYTVCRPLVRSFLKARKGKIINISSVIGLAGNGGQTNYAASKAGIIGFTKALALELASRRIGVNCIAPGFIDTSMTEELTPPQKEGILKKIPLGYIGKPRDVAELALFLASDLSNYITGQVITVDGGMVM
jgi:3-oxoacyl-[acyl-carrier protein] reductase